MMRLLGKRLGHYRIIDVQQLSVNFSQVVPKTFGDSTTDKVTYQIYTEPMV